MKTSIVLSFLAASSFVTALPVASEAKSVGKLNTNVQGKEGLAKIPPQPEPRENAALLRRTGVTGIPDRLTHAVHTEGLNVPPLHSKKSEPPTSSSPLGGLTDTLGLPVGGLPELPGGLVKKTDPPTESSPLGGLTDTLGLGGALPALPGGLVKKTDPPTESSPLGGLTDTLGLGGALPALPGGLVKKADPVTSASPFADLTDTLDLPVGALPALPGGLVKKADLPTGDLPVGDVADTLGGLPVGDLADTLGGIAGPLPPPTPPSDE